MQKLAVVLDLNAVFVLVRLHNDNQRISKTGGATSRLLGKNDESGDRKGVQCRQVHLPRWARAGG